MKRCVSHYPIIGNWDIIEETRDYTVWKCPRCGEIKKNEWFHGRLEFVPDSIKESRLKHAKDLIQPFRGNELSKEYVKEYPESVKKMVKEGHVTKKQVKEAKNVWKGDVKGI